MNILAFKVVPPVIPANPSSPRLLDWHDAVATAIAAEELLKIVVSIEGVECVVKLNKNRVYYLPI